SHRCVRLPCAHPRRRSSPRRSAARPTSTHASPVGTPWRCPEVHPHPPASSSPCPLPSVSPDVPSTEPPPLPSVPVPGGGVVPSVEPGSAPVPSALVGSAPVVVLSLPPPVLPPSPSPELSPPVGSSLLEGGSYTLPASTTVTTMRT